MECVCVCVKAMDDLGNRWQEVPSIWPRETQGFDVESRNCLVASTSYHLVIEENHGKSPWKQSYYIVLNRRKVYKSGPFWTMVSIGVQFP